MTTISKSDILTAYQPDYETVPIRGKDLTFKTVPGSRRDTFEIYVYNNEEELGGYASAMWVAMSAVDENDLWMFGPEEIKIIGDALSGDELRACFNAAKKANGEDTDTEAVIKNE